MRPSHRARGRASGRGADTLATAADRLRAVLDVSRALTSLHDETELLDLIVSSACQCLGYGACTLIVRDDASGAYRYRATAGCSPELDRQLRTMVMSPEACAALQAAATRLGSVLYIPPGHPVRAHPAVRQCIVGTTASVPAHGWQAGSLLFVPLLGLNDDVVGFLNPDDPEDGRLPNRGQIAVLETFAHQAVVALQMVRGRAVERERVQWAEAQRRQLEGLLQASASVRGTLQLDQVLQQIAAAMTSAGGFGGAVIYLRDEDDNLHARATVGIGDGEDARLRATPIPFGMFQHLMQPEMRLSRSYLFDHRYHSTPPELDAAMSIPALPPDWQEGQWHPEDSLTVPLDDRAGRCIGLISVDEPYDKAYPDLARIQALELFADHCVIAVEHAALYAEMQQIALTDALTGLPNRTLLHDRLNRAIATAQRAGSSLALLLMDLDRFKEVNDTLGHHYGDLLLQHVGSRVRGVLRDADTVARLGGDEFAVVLPGTDVSGAQRVADAILATLDVPLTVDGHALDVGASIGITVYPDHGADVPTLLRHADVAMYRAKRAHRGYGEYQEDHDHHNPHRLTLMTALRQSIADDGLELHYQPLLTLAEGAVTGVEALLRWQHPEHGPIPPDLFVPLAEHTGVIVPLTRWVLDAALRQCHEWQRTGRWLGIAVNLSRRTLHDTELPQTVQDLLRRYDVAPRYLTLEITESALMVDPVRGHEVLDRLARLGVRIAIDDFGSGYSSLGYLKLLPVHEVKIDKSFVLGMATNPKDAAIVRSVVAMTHALNLTVVAEGIETAEAWTTLQGLSCDVGQGYYVSRPLPAGEATRWLQDRRPARLDDAVAPDEQSA